MTNTVVETVNIPQDVSMLKYTVRTKRKKRKKKEA